METHTRPRGRPRKETQPEPTDAVKRVRAYYQTTQRGMAQLLKCGESTIRYHERHGTIPQNGKARELFEFHARKAGVSLEAE